MTNPSAVQSAIRIDKWLWAARFFKTRQLAVKALKTGKISNNAQACKPASSVKVDDIIDLKRGPYQLQFEVVALSEQRGPATVAQTLYRETEESIAARKMMKQSLDAQPQIKRDARKPNKRAVRNSRELKRQG